MTGNSCRRLLGSLSLLLLLPVVLHAQKDAPADRSTEPARLPAPTAPWRHPVSSGTVDSAQIVQAAGIIFSGRVISVGGAAVSLGKDAVSTTVTFQVDHAMRGTSAGQNLTIHEWAGLWARGERYRVGENVLLFLYPPSKLGLTSPVAGPMGKFAIDPQGRILMNAQNLMTFAADPLIGRRTVVSYADFEQAVRRGGGEK